MVKIDPYKHKERYLGWKIEVVNGIPNVMPENSDLIRRYVFDMESGLNISIKSKKGARSYVRLNNLRQRLLFIAKLIETRCNKSLNNITETDIFGLFNAMRNGEIKRKDGKEYKSTGDYVKVFKAFWHWHQKTIKKKGKKISDITEDLDCKQEKPEWVYLNEEHIRKLCDNALLKYKVLIMFLIDSGIRAPTELMNVKVSDLTEDCKELNIREEVSKTFGRRIKLMICSSILKDYINHQKLSKGDALFKISPKVVNKYLKRLAKKVLGDEKSLAGQKYSDLTMYDCRHNSACYWMPRYKSESAMKYRFGWKKSDMMHYYTEFLGMKDTISEEDLMIDTTKTEFEKRTERSEKENELLKERMMTMENQMKKILELTNTLYKRLDG